MNLAFTRFAPGTPVTINGLTAPAWGVPSGIPFPFNAPPIPDVGVTVTILPTRSNLEVAPEAFGFELSYTGFDTNTLVDATVHDPSFIDKYVFWDFGDDYDYAAPVNLPYASARKSRYSMGPIGSHTYRAAGNYTVNVLVFETSSGKWGSASYRIGGANEDTPTIQDPDVLFSGDKTVHVDPDGVHANAPTGSIERTTIAAALTYANSTDGEHRIQLARGKQHAVTSALIHRPSIATRGGFYLCADAGAGANPTVDTSSYNFGSGQAVIQDQGNRDTITGTRDFRVIDVQSVGGWNPIGETGGVEQFIFSFLNRSDYMLVDGCEIGDYGTAMQIEGATTGQSYFINDTVVDGFQNFGILDGSGMASYMTGIRITQDVDAANGGPTGTSFNNHGPIRWSQTRLAHVVSSDFFSNNGHGATIPNHQPALRFVTSSTYGGERVNCQSCAVEGGYNVILFHNVDANVTTAPINAMVANSVILGNWSTAIPLLTEMGGVVFENLLVIIPDSARDNSSAGGANTNPIAFFRTNEVYTSNVATRDANRSAPIRVRHCSFICLLSDANGVGGAFSGMGESTLDPDFTNVVVEDNVLHVPNSGTPINAGNFDTSSHIFTPRSKGFRDTSRVLDAAFATPGDTVRAYIPIPTNAAIDADTSPPLVAFGGIMRGNPSENGAFEQST